MSLVRQEDCAFVATLEAGGLDLVRDTTRILQVNVGLRCDLACRHCHLEAGPGRNEVMDRATMAEVVACAARLPFELADITGGAPELVPHLDELLAGLAREVPRVTLRTNLTALDARDREPLLAACVRHRVSIVASLPAATPGPVDAQRGQGVWERSAAMLRQLNALGYGVADSGLELHLVANPAGAFLPQGQAAAERQFRRALARKLGIAFNRLYVFGNVPLGRFRSWLAASGNLDDYLARLRNAFNPCTLEGLMCRSLVSVRWDGVLFDCDFNLAADLPLGGRPRHVRDLDALPEAGSPIALGDHCYACTAGAGFT